MISSNRSWRMSWKGNHLICSGILCVILLPTLITCISISSIEHDTVEDTTIMEDTTNFQTDNKLRVCGQRLTSEINAICNVGYYTPSIIYPQPTKNHRSNIVMRSNEVRIHHEREREHSNEINIPTRVSRGVIEECCRKPCDRQTLLKYCANHESRRNGSETETEGTATTPSPILHFLQKRTSVFLQQQQEKGQIATTASSKKKYKKDESESPHIVDNCLHCGGKNTEDKKGSDNLTRSGCRKNRGRKSRRLKLRRKDDGQFLLVPLLLQLLWDWEKMGNSNSQRGTKNFYSQPPPLDALYSPRRQRPGTNGRITAREVTGRATNQSPISLLHSRLKPASDETVRDMEEDLSVETNDFPRGQTGHRHRVRTYASEVTDAPQPQVFALPAGTNADFFTL